MWPNIEAKIRRRERLTPIEGVYLLSEAPLLDMGALAQEVRAAKTDPKVVTYVIDTNPNYTNVCTIDCHFCAFYRKPGHAEGYPYDLEGVMNMMETAHRRRRCRARRRPAPRRDRARARRGTWR